MFGGKKMKKRVITVLAVCLCAVTGALTGLMEKPECDRIYSQALKIHMDFDDVLEAADVVLVGKVDKVTKFPQYDEYDVDVVDIKKGEVNKNLKIRNYLCDYSYNYNGIELFGRTSTDYSEGEKYIFTLQHIRNVYEDKYVILADTYIPLSSVNDSSILSKKISDEKDPVSYIENYIYKSSGSGEKLSIDYIESNNVEEIVKYSDYIAEVTVLEHCRETEVSDVYFCKIDKVIKGSINTAEDDTILIPFFKNSVNVGGAYIVNLTSDTADTIIYTLTSKNSVMGISDADAVEQALGMR